MGIEEGERLAALVERGGIFYGIPGTSPEKILTGLISRLPGEIAPQGDLLLKAVLEREALMSTGIGRGIALPHPRNPLITDENKQFVAIAFPEIPVDWKALDGRAVHAALLIVSASARLHLHTLSKINFLCRQEEFLELLQNRAPQKAIITAIGEAEKTWR
ncbi:MAG: PTS sugar transporter subunit IIA [Treponema sp.]|jgi:PTS system nitrogen regulatory IIA component|nr:PTS sugar transporter subunit IIA [Treponema sp.]